MLGVRPDWLDHAEKQLIQQGLTNQAFRLSHEGRFYFYRRAMMPSESILIQRASEAQVLQAVSSFGVTPDVYFYADDGQEMLMAWVNEPQWDATYFSSDAGISQLANLCAQIHQFAPPIHQLSLADYLHQLSTPHEREIPKNIQQANIAALNWLTQLPPVKPVLCHNDMNPTNLLGKRPRLIDWEYAALGDPAFELAGIASAGQFSEPQLKELIQAYQACGQTIDPMRVIQMQQVVDLVGYYWCERMLGLRMDRQSEYRAYQAELAERIMNF